ncbi:MAG: gliding motility-associated C-terminal domain-containing protein [Bacteroidota bacterium]|nr:gliding motility-associated C-terminal domain-containing protein [Bacteroidota bacterium]
MGNDTAIYIEAPLVSTVYYVLWENNCGPSECASLAVNVIQKMEVLVNVLASENPVESGQTVFFTAVPKNEGEDPFYTWMIDGNIVQEGSHNTYTSSSIVDGQVLSVELNSSEECVINNLAYGEILMGVSFRPRVYAPNAFTPDDDDRNDVFRVYGPVDEFSKFRMHIYDRWGNNVFESMDMSDGWNGIIDGWQAPAGVYVWIANYTIKPSAVVTEGESKTQKGSFVLIR